MISHRTLKIVAIVFILISVIATATGYELAIDENVTRPLVERNGLDDF